MSSEAQVLRETLFPTSTLTVRNVHEALPEGIRLLQCFGTWEDSRNGVVRTVPYPVLTVYERPKERVLFWPQRNANPFFHLMEALWMLGGRHDVKWIVRFNSRMRDYSDDGETFHGAYGFRWRRHFLSPETGDPIDQLKDVVELLRRTPDTRRAVIQMYDCTNDLCVVEKLHADIPCNSQIYLRQRGGRLDMTVMGRSHDIIWGLFGANAVHFSILQEYLAASLGWEVGRLYQFSNDFHAYKDVYERNLPLVDESKDPYIPRPYNPYLDRVQPSPLMDNPESFDEELRIFLSGEDESTLYENAFLTLAKRVRDSYLHYKDNKFEEALELLLDCPENWDFAVACREWLERKRY